jgi:uncharacterized protein (DUF1015 family)
MEAAPSTGLSLAPFRALRYAVPDARLGRLLCPPYDVIDESARSALLEADPDNAVAVVLPRSATRTDPYDGAAECLGRWVQDGLVRPDGARALYVYEMRTSDGGATRGLIGALELRSYADGVILPHENTMAGPVADRLALMLATEANLEPIYLVYDGGGAASDVVAEITAPALASAVTPDGTTHRVWAISDTAILDEVAMDLGKRRALIADGHHRYATYLELQQRLGAERGAGPWDRGLALLVDSSSYGPQVHAIHRVLPTLPLAQAVAGLADAATVLDVGSADEGLAQAERRSGFAAVLTDGTRNVLVTDPVPALLRDILAAGEPTALGELDVTVLHRALVARWGLSDDVGVVDYAHSQSEAIAAARSAGGTAVLLRPTPVAAVASVAAAGARMPRKSTLFTPKPASGLVMRRFVDQSRSS